jgi:hypothetical protein
MPDISLEVANWAANDDVVFVECEISGTLAGRSLKLDRDRCDSSCTTAAGPSSPRAHEGRVPNGELCRLQLSD